jgi:hypothetical protein
MGALPFSRRPFAMGAIDMKRNDGGIGFFLVFP